MKRICWLFILIATIGNISACALPNNTASDADIVEISSNVPELVKTSVTQDKNKTDELLSSLQVHYIDCGQADATLIKNGNNAMLIDAGENNQGTAIQLFLQKQGVKSLDYIIGTHPDSDHIGGMDVIITKFDCKTIMLPEIDKDTATYRDVVSAMEYKRYKNSIPVVGKKYQLGDAEFTIIAPNDEYDDNHNDWSIGLILTHGNNKFLFTGDAEDAGEYDIVNNGIDISCDVYKVGHHGSKSSTSQELLNAANPKFAVISCGADNSYGHPDADTLNKLKTKNIQVFRTDEQGTVVATSDGENITWDCSPSNTWQAGEFKPVNKGNVVKEILPSSVDEPAYILNTSSKKFHKFLCKGLPTKNRKDTNMSRDEVISTGYVPCKMCKP